MDNRRTTYIDTTVDPLYQFNTYRYSPFTTADTSSVDFVERNRRYTYSTSLNYWRDFEDVRNFWGILDSYYWDVALDTVINRKEECEPVNIEELDNII